jgi:hypothetical protein
MSDEKIISGEDASENVSDGVLASDGTASATVKKEQVQTTLHDRIATATEAGGLKELPDDFDEHNGDWTVITSKNPFEVLYLDYKQYKFITPEIVNNNYTLLEKFWRNKVGLMNTGGNRVSFKNKYGEATVDTSLNKLKSALEKLNTKQGIEQYYIEINNERLRKGESQLLDTLQHMTIDGNADKQEIKLCLDRGVRNNLSLEETAVIIKKHLDTASMLPYEEPTGSTLVEKLLSTDWMTPQKKKEADDFKRQREASRIQIVSGKYASTLEEIGSILYDHPVEAKDLIRRDLLSKVVAQKDMVLGNEIGNISEQQKNPDIAYLSIIYKLNHTLPYKLMPGREAKSVKELSSLSFENEQTLKVSKEHMKKGYTEVWLRETDKTAYNTFIKIRDTSENIDLAFIKFLYTFNPELGYRLGGRELVETPVELSTAINRSRENWESGRTELFNSSIITWLSTTGQSKIVDQWNRIKDQFKSREDTGLEYFLHVLDPSLKHSKIVADKSSIDYPQIQSGQFVSTDIVFTNETRGCSEFSLAFSKEIPGVALSASRVIINNVTGASTATVKLTINSNVLLKGVHYETTIIATTFEQQKIEIPVSFKIVFPRNSFIGDMLKYALFGALFFLLVRGILYTEYPDWMNTKFDAFVQWDDAVQYYGRFGIFGGAFFAFLAGLVLGLIFLIKYLRK